MVAPAKTAYDLEQFSLKDMTECGVALRKIGADAACMEEVAQRSVNFLFDALAASNTQGKACALARFWGTMPFAKMPPDLQAAARQSGAADENGSCLVLLGSRGVKVEWNDRKLSQNHRAIPLDSPVLMQRAPMVAQLMAQLGAPIERQANRACRFLVDEKQRNYNVLHVPDASNAAIIDSQQEFTVAHNIKSLVGFGGVLPSGNFFSVMLFLRSAISHQAALAFRPFALNTKIALMPFDQPESMFAPRN
jgi:two-component system NtrC family sensor kinase